MRSRASKSRAARGVATAVAAAALALLAPVAGAGAAPVLEPTGSLLTERYKAAAAPLPGGDALVVGGLHRISLASPAMESLASAELYDGASGTFSATGWMAVSRMDPTAAPLPDGRVLVAGGQTWGGGGTPLASAEIYDPASGEFSQTGSMAVARFGAMAAPLPDGKILVAGGYGAGTLASAEVFDPATGEFSPTGSMVAARAMGLAAPLPDGRVLITAAGEGEDKLTTEIYDPLTGTFVLGPATTSRPLTGAGGTLDDGRVLFFSSSRAGYATINQTLEYDTAAGAFTVPAGAPDLTVERPAVSPLPGGRMLVVGGDSKDLNAFEGQSIVPFAAIYAEGPATSSPGAGSTGREESEPLNVTFTPASDADGAPAAAGADQSRTSAPVKSPAKKRCKRPRARGKQARKGRCGRIGAKATRSSARHQVR